MSMKKKHISKLIVLHEERQKPIIKGKVLKLQRSSTILFHIALLM